MSVERVRAALAEPPSRLSLSEKQADFSIDIREREEVNRFMTPILDFTVAPGTAHAAVSSAFGTPMVSVELLPLLNKARSAYRRHAATEEVRRAIAAYCAAQPDGGGGIRICDTIR